MGGSDDDCIVTRELTRADMESNMVRLGDNAWGENMDAINPSQNDMIAALGRERSQKCGNGNCFFLSAAESVGLMRGFNNQSASNQLRREVGATIRENIHKFFNDITQMPPRNGPHHAMDASMIAQMKDASGPFGNSQGVNNWVDYWIKQNIETDKEYTDDAVGGMGVAMRFNSHVVIIYSDIREQIFTKVDGVQAYSTNSSGVRVPLFTWGGFVNGSNITLISPNGDRRCMPFARLCTLFPPGPKRNDLKVLLYNGNLSLSGDHFEHAILKPEASTEGLCRFFDTLLSPNKTRSIQVPRQATPTGEDEYQQLRRRSENNKNLGKARQQLFAPESAPESSKASRITQHFPTTTNRFAALEEADAETEVEPKEKLAEYTRTETLYTPSKGNSVQVVLKTTPKRETCAERKVRLNVNANRKYRAKAGLVTKSKGKSKGKSQNQLKETNRKKSLESNTEKASEKAALARHSVRWAICGYVRQSIHPPTADSGPEWDRKMGMGSA
jgi:hypothetical protein